jgi:glycosyltransferase involved in cell wall biosynthesis
MASQYGNMPLVSVIVRTCPWRRHILLNCLRSIAAQDYRNIEIVVVEDGADEARTTVDRFRASTDLAVQYHSIPKGGRCLAGNQGLESAQGELLNFLDDDDEFYPHHVSTLAEVLSRQPELVAAYSRALEVPATIESFDPLIVVDEPGRPFREKPFSYAQLCYQNFLPIQSVMFRRGLFQRFGGFDVELEQLEDWNLWTRYFSAGELELVDKVTSFFRVPASSAEQLRRNSYIDRYFFVALHKQRRMLAEIGRGDVLQQIQVLELEHLLARGQLSGWITAHPVAKAGAIRVLGVMRRCVKAVRRLAAAVRTNPAIPYAATSRTIPLDADSDSESPTIAMPARVGPKTGRRRRAA